MLPLMSVENLQVQFHSRFTQTTAVDDISFDIHQGETLAVVGESGSGKSVTALSIMGLIKKAGGMVPHGTICFRNQAGKAIDLVGASETEMRSIRGNEIAMIFQEPMTSLNPVFTIRDQIKESLIRHKKCSPAEAEKRILDVMKQVRIPEPEKRLEQFPHQLSGGMRQRVMIAIALVCKPKLLIADEPTTALDVTIQAQILWLLKKLKEETDTTLMFITHDLGVVAQIAERVIVMSEGKIVETGEVNQIFKRPAVKYTRDLLNSVPVLGQNPKYSDPSSELQAKDSILKVNELTVRFPVRSHFWSKNKKDILAVENVSLKIEKGKTLGLVGESGCGKSTVCKAIVGLVQGNAGQIIVDDIAVNMKSWKQSLALRKKVQIVFQDPMAALSPRRSAYFQIAEPLIIHRYGSSSEIRERVEWLINRVGLTSAHLQRYPHEFSGGQRQRLCIARALALNPCLVIADEPVSALDVSVQAKVLDLLEEIQDEFGVSYLFVSHDMAVVERMCQDVAVMHMGRILEYGKREAVFSSPKHPYTQNLLQSVPVPDPDVAFRLPSFYEEGRKTPLVNAKELAITPVVYTQESSNHFVAYDKAVATL